MKCHVTEISATTLCEAISVFFFPAWLDFINILLCTGMFSSPLLPAQDDGLSSALR